MNRTYLDQLESESVYVLREAIIRSKNPVLLFSGGKDSKVLLRLAMKAFWPLKLPLPLLHIDTGHNFKEVISFRDEIVSKYGLNIIVYSVQDSIDRGSVLLNHNESRNASQSTTLMEAIRERNIDLLLGGARRDEGGARSKERIFSLRDSSGTWDLHRQRIEPWDLYNAFTSPGDHLRVFPLSNWTELDIWHYIKRESIELPSLYYSHRRSVIVKGDYLIPVTSLSQDIGTVQTQSMEVRFRTVGDMTCTCPVPSTARDVGEVIEELTHSRLSERGATRLDDKVSETSMETRKKQGYF